MNLGRHSPNISLGCENAVEKRLGRHPLDRQHRLAALSVVVRPVDVPRHPEVCDLGNPSGAPVEEEDHVYIVLYTSQRDNSVTILTKLPLPLTLAMAILAA